MNSGETASDAGESPLDVAVAEYLLAVEKGQTPERGEFLARYPELAATLAGFLDDRELLTSCLSLPKECDDETELGLPLACPNCHNEIKIVEHDAVCVDCGALYGLEHHAQGAPALRIVGRFRLCAVLGRGGFSTVYKAWDPEARRFVAVKVPRNRALADPRELARFLREARFAVELYHPGIARCYELGQSDGRPYLVNEFVDGGTLADLIRDDRPSFDDAARLIVAVADALHHAHKRGIVHRDIKPTNIMIREGRTPVVVDFGLAMRRTTEPNLTDEGAACGTVEFMSPEQVRGASESIGAASDIYSTGVVLYELLVGVRPFVGVDRMVVKQILDDEPRPPRRLNDQVPVDLETICLKCLRKAPEERYRSAAELAEDLSRFRSNLPIKARPAGRIERARKWARRNPALAAAAALAAIFLVATTAVATGWGLHAIHQAAIIRAELAHSELLIAEGHVDRGLAEAREGHVAAGILWMARGIESARSSAENLQWVARANLSTWQHELLPLVACWNEPPGHVLGFDPTDSSAWVVDPTGRVVERWNLAQHERCGLPLQHPDQVTALGVAPNGASIATGCERAGEPVRLWDVRTGALTRSLDAGGSIFGIAYFPDGERILTARKVSEPNEARVSTEFQTWNVSSGAAVGGPFRHPDWLCAMAIGPDGKTLYTATAAGKEIRAWDLTAGRFLRGDMPQPVPVTSLAVSADGAYLASGGSDRLARLIDAQTGQPLVSLLHRNPVSSVAFGAGGKWVITASASDAVRVWAAGNRIEPLANQNGGGVRALAMSPDCVHVATGSDDRIVRLWRIDEGTLVKESELAPHESAVAMVTFSPQGNLVVTSTYQHTGATIWDAHSGLKRSALADPDIIHTVVFDAIGTKLATAGYGTTVQVWDAVTFERTTGPLDHGNVPLAVAFAPDGRSIVTAGEGGLIRRWDLATGLPLGDPWLHGAGATVKVAAFSPDGQTLLTAGDDGFARMWDYQSGQVCGVALDHGHAIWTACYSADGRAILTGGRDGTAQIWLPSAGARVGPPLRHGDRIWAVDISPDSRWAVTASADSTANLWDLATGRALGPPLRHRGEVRCAKVTADGRWIVTTGMDSTARVWPAPRVIGPASNFVLWAQVATGAELDHTGGVHVLSSAEWSVRHERLKKLSQPIAQ
jgi:WD40 repeat protein